MFLSHFCSKIVVFIYLICSKMYAWNFFNFSFAPTPYKPQWFGWMFAPQNTEGTFHQGCSLLGGSEGTLPMTGAAIGLAKGLWLHDLTY